MSRMGINRGPRWTPEEDAILRNVYAKKGIGATRKLLPHRSDFAITKRSSALGLRAEIRWTAEDEQRFRILWGERTVKELGRLFKRNEWAIRRKALAMGLPFGPPQGYETLRGAAKRCGFPPSTFLRILHRYHVHIRVLPTTMVKSKQFSRRIACTHDIDEAVEKWLGTETPEDAARRYGMVSMTIRTWLTAAGHAPMYRGRGVTWRLPSDVYDKVIADRIEKIRTSETLGEASLRTRVRPASKLAPILQRAGLLDGKHNPWLLNPADVDRVVAEWRDARASQRKARVAA